MYKTTTKYPSAWIVNPNDRGRKKIYLNSKIYLDNNQEFIIELFNPTQDSVLAEIKINGKIASSTGLILRPGERFYLDCFVDDKKKFIFKTYEVENTSESLDAISNNGNIEITFFREKTNIPPYFNIGTTKTYPNLWSGNTNPYYYDSFITTSSSGTPTNVTLDDFNTGTNTVTFAGNSAYFSNTSFTSDNLGNDIKISNSLNSRQPIIKNKSVKKTETGRIEKGEKSNQKFESVSMEFETFHINKISYQLLPNSKKPIETSEIKRNFCSSCGHKLKGTEKFCPSCGTRV